MKGLALIVFLAYSLASLILGVMGIGHEFGYWWAFAAFAAFIFARFAIPISVGVYLYAHHVLGWHWIGAAAFAFPLVAVQVALLFGVTLATAFEYITRPKS